MLIAQLQEQPITAETASSSRMEQLYRDHASAAARLAYLLTGDRAAAEDLVQEAFIRVAGRAISVRDPAVFRAYLRRTIINLHTSQQRRRKVERAYLQREAARPAPDDALPDVELQEHLLHRLRALPPRQRAALVLRYYEDLSEGETAEVLGCSRSAARSLTARGLDALRSDMRGESS